MDNLVLEMCGSLPKDLPFCNPDSPDYEGHDCMTCIVECYGETVGQGMESQNISFEKYLAKFRNFDFQESF